MAWHPLPSEVGEWKQLLHWRDDVQAQLQQARNRQQQLQRHPYRHRAVLDGRQRLIQTLEAEPARAEQAIKEQVKRHVGISRQGERSVRSRLYMGAMGAFAARILSRSFIIAWSHAAKRKRSPWSRRHANS